jgi:hypothetical protein
MTRVRMTRGTPGEKLEPRTRICQIESLEGDWKINYRGPRNCSVSKVDLAAGVVSGGPCQYETSVLRNERPYSEVMSRPTVPVARRPPADIVIRVDPDVFAILQKRAVPLEDTPNTVLRRNLGARSRASGLAIPTSPVSASPARPARSVGPVGNRPAAGRMGRPVRLYWRYRRAHYHATETPWGLPSG